MNKAPRCTRFQLAKAEAHQSAVIADLTSTGHVDLARRLTRCQHARRHRQRGRYPFYRCRSAGCWADRRNLIRKWWEAFRNWFTGVEITLAVIPISSDPIAATRKLRKGLRDIRDRSARQDHGWRAVAIAGLIDGARALVLIQHAGISRDEVWSVLERRWPKVGLYDPGDIEPSALMSAEDAASLARCRRGIEPLRVVIMPQVASANDPWDEAMPMLF